MYECIIINEGIREMREKEREEGKERGREGD